MVKKNLITGALTVTIVALMVGASELLNEKEIIFPEITALAVGALVAPKRAWRTSLLRIILLIAICAVTGVLIVLYVPLPLWEQISLAYLLCQIIYLYSGTTFAPLISAMVLPVLLGTKSPIYIISAVVLSSIIAFTAWLLEKTELSEPEHFTPAPPPKKEDFKAAAVRVIIVAFFTGIALKVDAKFCIAPPLLVAFTEFSRPDCKARKMPVRAVILITLCAAAGAACRCIMTMSLGLPLTAVAALAAIIMLLLLHGFKMYLPPAGAMTILAMLIPAGLVTIYPLQVFAGATILTFFAIMYFNNL
ncbi:MAG: hypothetical protein ACI4SS_04275 [Clostridia bacterium]